MVDEYDPTWESLDEHPTPDWYEDAKLGIFIVWGVYSVPAWAPTDAVVFEDLDTASPYGEWYPYYMYEDGSPTKEYHEENYGEDFEYDEFVEMWDAEKWNPDEWAQLFADVGARYVVMIAEHHDGFANWQSHYTKYNTAEMGPNRDLVDELAGAVRDQGMRYSPSYHANLNYYQPGFEGRWGHPDYQGGDILGEETGPGPEYVDFMNAKHRELIRKYEPDLLWFDVPEADADHLNAKELIADYYNTAREEWDKEVAVNDRASEDAQGLTFTPDGMEFDPENSHGDFVTPEYRSFDEIEEEKWEACRGIGKSFSYNAAEGPEDHLSVEELVHSFVDIVSKNGNLLLSIGPKADGTIPELQRERLEGLGRWLDLNGDAIFGTTYWVTPDDDKSDIETRYTWKDGVLYAICLEWPGDELLLGIDEHVDSDSVDRVSMLGGPDTLGWELTADGFHVETPERPDTEHAYVVRIDSVPNPRN